MKKLLTAILALTLCMTSSTFAAPSEEAVGNTSGNLNNKGWCAAQGDWIYYNSLSREGGLYKVKKDGTEKTKIDNDNGWYLNLSEDSLYYSGEQSSLTKLKLDGTDKRTLEKRAFHVQLVGDTLYYTHGGGYQHGQMYKMKTDGTGKQKLSGDSVSELTVQDGWIYYTSFYQKILKVDVNGKSKTRLLSAASGGGSISGLNVQGDWLYFNQNSKLYKMRTDGSELTKLSDDFAYNLNVSGDWVYYCDYSGNKNLVRIRTDGTQRQELTQRKSLDIHVLGSYVFYNDMSKMNKLELPELVELEEQPVEIPRR
ncbi:DUF5050 domain-containing protein [Paenibacillus sp. CN-4]|uniref:DUF5050 domain-containing protein n=1 Tax=Paenibacillus nanchangensis TaxID=3348343 RepID=UPI00397D238E